MKEICRNLDVTFQAKLFYHHANHRNEIATSVDSQIYIRNLVLENFDGAQKHIDSIAVCNGAMVNQPEFPAFWTFPTAPLRTSIEIGGVGEIHHDKALFLWKSTANKRLPPKFGNGYDAMR